MFTTQPETAAKTFTDQVALTAAQASSAAHRGLDAVRHGQQQLREQAHRASDSAVGYVRDEPVKSMLMAAAAGATLMALATLVRRARSHD